MSFNFSWRQDEKQKLCCTISVQTRTKQIQQMYTPGGWPFFLSGCHFTENTSNMATKSCIALKHLKKTINKHYPQNINKIWWLGNIWVRTLWQGGFYYIEVSSHQSSAFDRRLLERSMPLPDRIAKWQTLQQHCTWRISIVHVLWTTVIARCLVLTPWLFFIGETYLTLKKLINELPLAPLSGLLTEANTHDGSTVAITKLVGIL